jgi:sRNA-binding carbon storage regulator CsrA
MLMFSRRSGERVVIGGTLLMILESIDRKIARVSFDDAWPETIVCAAELPRYSDGTLLFEPRHARRKGYPWRAIDKPTFNVATGDALLVDDRFLLFFREVRCSVIRLGIVVPLEVPAHRWETFLSIINEGRPPPAIVA